MALKDFLKDVLPTHSSELLLSFDEYVDSWGELIEVGYGSIMADEEAFPSLGLDENSAVQFSVEAALVLCHDAMRTWRRGRRVRERLFDSLEEAVVMRTGATITGDDAAAGEFLNLYKAHAPAFAQLMPHAGNPDDEKEIRELVMTLRYVVSRCTGKNDDGNLAGIQRFSTHLAEAHKLFKRLDRNSIPDGNTLFSKKPRFIVRTEL